MSYRVFDARTFVPQHRERVIIVATKKRAKFDFDDVRIPIKSPKLEKILHSDGTDRTWESRFLDERSGKVLSKYTLSDNLWSYLQKYAEKHRLAGNGFGFGLFGPNDVARTLSARYHKDGSEILIKQNRKNPRRLTPREAARIMGFPDSFQITVSDTQAYRQFGNSVVVPLLSEISKSVVRQNFN